jgi:hypothetical protein
VENGNRGIGRAKMVIWKKPEATFIVSQVWIKQETENIINYRFIRYSYWIFYQENYSEKIRVLAKGD